MSLLQPLTGRGFVLPRISIRTVSTAGPVNGDAGQKRIIPIIAVGGAHHREQEKYC